MPLSIEYWSSDVLLCSVKSGKYTDYIIWLHIPPQTIVSDFELFFEYLESLMCIFENIKFLGDFNAEEFVDKYWID